jgi:HK97 gp10 family phage protein
VDVTFTLHGAEDVQRKLAALGDEKRVVSVTTKAARKAMNIVRDAARNNARAIDDPASPAIIPKNIVTANSPRGGRRIGGVVMRVGVMGGANTRSPGEGIDALPGKDTRHWRYVEFGAEKVPARPFMRPALENNVGRVSDAVFVELERQLAKLPI